MRIQRIWHSCSITFTLLASALTGACAQDSCITQRKHVDVPGSSSYVVQQEEVLCDNVAHSDEISVYVAPNEKPEDEIQILKYDYDPIVGDVKLRWLDSHRLEVSGTAVKHAKIRQTRARDIEITYSD